MNRREALHALVAIPTAAGIQITEAKVEPDLQPGDLVVLSCKQHLSGDQIAHLRQLLEHEIRPKVKVLVLEAGMTLTVHRGVAKVETV